MSVKESSDTDQFEQLERIKPRNTTVDTRKKQVLEIDSKLDKLRKSLISTESNKDKLSDDDMFVNMARRARSESISVPRLLDESGSSYASSVQEDRKFWESAYMGRIFP